RSLSGPAYAPPIPAACSMARAGRMVRMNAIRAPIFSFRFPARRANLPRGHLVVHAEEYYETHRACDRPGRRSLSLYGARGRATDRTGKAEGTRDSAAQGQVREDRAL